MYCLEVKMLKNLAQDFKELIRYAKNKMSIGHLEKKVMGSSLNF